MRRLAQLAAVAVLAAALPSCSSLNPFAKKELRPCPRLSVLRDASRITEYRPGKGRDLLDVRYTAHIDDVKATCKYDEQTLRMTVAIDLVFTRGPAAEGSKMHAPYFVAITHGDGEILAKRIFDSDIDFPKRRRRAGVREEVDETIPLLPDETGAAYEVVIGMQVSEEQLKRNRSQ